MTVSSTARAGTSTVTVRGRQARYRVTGDGPPVLLLHGIGRSLEDWTEQHDLLDGYRVHSLDLAGYGRSEPLREPHTLPSLARFVEDFLDAVGLSEPVHLAGNSLGGAVAMQTAAQAPERVRDLVLVNSAGFGREVTVLLRLLTVPVLGELMMRPTRFGVRRSEQSIFHDPSFVTEERIAHALESARRPHAARVMLETARSLGTPRGVRQPWRTGLLEEVAALGTPVLAVWGDRDLVLPAAHLDAVTRHLPAARTHLFPDTGHMPQIERAEQFSALVTEFWAGQGEA